MSIKRFCAAIVALLVATALFPAATALAAVNKAPRITKAEVKDADGDGKADRIVLTYSERINHKLDTSRFPFRVEGYKVIKVGKARRATKLTVFVKENANAPLKPAFVKYSRTRQQPVKDLKGKQAVKQLLREAKIVGLPPVTESFDLTVQKGGNATGTVTSTPSGINCGTTCTATYEDGEQVTLTATPDAASSAEFGGWTGCTSTDGTSCTVTMDADKTIGVSFEAAGSNTLTVSREGNGTVTSSSTPSQDTQINCGVTCASTNASYPENALVKLTAVPGQTGMVITWGGACSGTGQTCDVLMNGPKNVTVKFEIPKLTVTKTGTGTGTVTSEDGGVNCGSDCEHEYAKDAVVELTAAAASGSEFKGWTGGATCGLELTCNVTMSQSKTVSAAFDLLPITTEKALDLTVTGPGTVTCSVDGGAAAACGESYEEGTMLTLIAAPMVNPPAINVFSGWGGDCSSFGVLLTCTLEMTGDKTVSATFVTQSVI